MTDWEVASALNIIAEAHKNRTTYIDVANRYISFEGPENQEEALAKAVDEFMSSVEYIEIEPEKQTGIQQLTDKISWDI